MLDGTYTMIHCISNLSNIFIAEISFTKQIHINLHLIQIPT